MGRLVVALWLSFRPVRVPAEVSPRAGTPTLSGGAPCSGTWGETAAIQGLRPRFRNLITHDPQPGPAASRSRGPPSLERGLPARGKFETAALRAPSAGKDARGPRKTATSASPPDRAEVCTQSGSEICLERRQAPRRLDRSRGRQDYELGDDSPHTSGRVGGARDPSSRAPPMGARICSSSRQRESASTGSSRAVVPLKHPPPKPSARSCSRSPAPAHRIQSPRSRSRV